MDKDNAELKQELHKALQRAKNELPHFRSVVEDKNVVVFVGNTRSGKSTLINYVIRTKLVAFELRRNLYKIEKAYEQAYGPHIGQGPLSDTTIPGVYSMDGDNDTFAVDAPGFGDNRGEVQDILNAVFVSQMKHAKTCKFVLVQDVNEIVCDNVAGFLTMLAKINELMPDFNRLRVSMSLVVTKDNNEYTQDEIATLLRDKFLEVQGLDISENSRRLLAGIIERNELIALFRMPSREGEVTDEVSVNIEGAILHSSPLVMQNVKIQCALSSETRFALLKMYQEFSDQMNFKEELMKITSQYQNYFSIDKYVFASTDEELHHTKCSLTRINNKLCAELNGFMFNIQHVLSSLGQLIHLNGNEFNKTLMLFVMLDEAALVKQTHKAQLIRKYKYEVEQVQTKVNMLINKIEDEEKDRRESNIQFSTLAATGAAGGAAALGAFLLRSVTMGSAGIYVLGAFSGIGTVLTVAGAVVSAASYFAQQEKLKKRKSIRRQQGRSVLEERSQ